MQHLDLVQFETGQRTPLFGKEAIRRTGCTAGKAPAACQPGNAEEGRATRPREATTDASGTTCQAMRICTDRQEGSCPLVEDGFRGLAQVPNAYHCSEASRQGTAFFSSSRPSSLCGRSSSGRYGSFNTHQLSWPGTPLEHVTTPWHSSAVLSLGHSNTTWDRTKKSPISPYQTLYQTYSWLKSYRWFCFDWLGGAIFDTFTFYNLGTVVRYGRSW